MPLGLCVPRLQCFDCGGEVGKQESVPRLLVTAFQVGLEERAHETLGFSVLRLEHDSLHGRRSQKEYLKFSNIYSRRAFALLAISLLWTIFSHL
jgi:hypothetical protein